MDQGLKTKRLFGFSFAVGMTLLTGLGVWHQWPLWGLAIPGTLAVWHLSWALINPRILTPTYSVVHFVGTWVSNILTALVFTAFYFGIFSPLAILLRLFGKDAIREIEKHQSWEDVPVEDNDPRRIEKLW